MEFPEDRHSPASAGPSRGMSDGCLKNCLIVFAVGMFVAVVSVGFASWWLYNNFRRVASDTANEALQSVVQEADLPDAEKQVLGEQIERVTEAYKSQRIDLEDVQRIGKQIAESPLLIVAILKEAASRYLDASEFGDEEKAAAELTIQRIQRGLYEQKIQVKELESPISTIIEDVDKGDSQRLKPPAEVSDDELRQLLGEFKQLADEREIPEEPFEINLGVEFRTIVDKALGEPR